MVFELLQQFGAFGENAAVSADNLMVATNTTRRELYRAIRSERLKGTPILSQKKNGGGYFLPLTDHDVMMCADRIDREGRAQQRAARKMRTAWKRGTV